MKTVTKSFGLILLAFGLASTSLQRATACTTVEIPLSKEKIVAKSYDWDQGHGTVFTNLKGIAKKAVALSRADTPATWVSKLGSLSFSQHGREFPLGGMNEKGLIVEIMWLNGSVYPAADARKMVNELQWIQYQLDQFETVAQVAAHADSIRVANAYAEVHYMVCDAKGECGTFEYIGGKLVSHFGKALPYPTLTNGTYADSSKELSRYIGFGGLSAIPTGDSSLDRFVRATSMARNFDPAGTVSAVDTAFSILDSVGGTSYTKFHIVYDPTSKTLRFRTESHPQIKQVEMSKFDWVCAKDRDKNLAYDMNQADKGDVASKFVSYTEKLNRAVIEEGLRDIASHLPVGMVDVLAAYPSQLPCL